ncbi:unnamed protein product [Phytophthora fragariaefolia]|uniref:Unnamed protein product n=1 Tax=Phytophthora fragariaefolia TaxID=1490495 RepID=A0A9W6YFJ9_9STRA|nr:unnamed protein product [Phytophthora fragariaefolia]
MVCHRVGCHPSWHIMAGPKSDGAELERSSEARAVGQLIRLRTLARPVPLGQQLSNLRPDSSPTANSIPAFHIIARSSSNVRHRRTRTNTATSRSHKRHSSMAPAGGDAPEARTQEHDAQERASQSGDASKASKSQETPAEASPSGDERRVHFAGNDGDSGEGHFDADGDEVMEGSTVDTEAKESDDPLNADPNGSSSPSAVSATLNASDKALGEHSFLAPGWRERRLDSNAEYAGLSASKLVPVSSFHFIDESAASSKLAGATSHRY